MNINIINNSHHPLPEYATTAAAGGSAVSFSMTTGMTAYGYYQSAIPNAGGVGGNTTTPTPVSPNTSVSYPYIGGFGGGGGGGYLSNASSGYAGAAGANGVVLVVTYF